MLSYCLKHKLKKIAEGDEQISVGTSTENQNTGIANNANQQQKQVETQAPAVSNNTVSISGPQNSPVASAAANTGNATQNPVTNNAPEAANNIPTKAKASPISPLEWQNQRIAGKLNEEIIDKSTEKKAVEDDSFSLYGANRDYSYDYTALNKNAIRFILAYNEPEKVTAELNTLGRRVLASAYLVSTDPNMSFEVKTNVERLSRQLVLLSNTVVDLYKLKTEVLKKANARAHPALAGASSAYYTPNFEPPEFLKREIFYPNGLITNMLPILNSLRANAENNPQVKQFLYMTSAYIYRLYELSSPFLGSHEYQYGPRINYQTGALSSLGLGSNKPDLRAQYQSDYYNSLAVKYLLWNSLQPSQQGSKVRYDPLTHLPEVAYRMGLDPTDLVPALNRLNYKMDRYMSTRLLPSDRMFYYEFTRGMLDLRAQIDSIISPIARVIRSEKTSTNQ